MAYLQSNIPHFKCWVRREYTHNHEQYHGEFLHAMAIAVTTMPNRCLSFQVIFTGCEADEEGEENVHGGAMWARMPITALVADEPLNEWPSAMLCMMPSLGTVRPTTTPVYVLDRGNTMSLVGKDRWEYVSCKVYVHR